MSTARAWSYTAAAVAAPFTALAFGSPEAMVAVVPVVVAVVVGMGLDPETIPSFRGDLSTEETLEHHPVELSLHVAGSGRRASVHLELDPQLVVDGVHGASLVGRCGLVVPLRRGRATVTMRVRALRWGTYPIGGGTVVVPGPLQMRDHAARMPASHTLVVLPGTETVRRLVEPLATNMHVGDLASKARGQGFEIAELRAWAPGDPPSAINWRATVRSDETVVTDRQAERNGDIVMIVDPVVDPGTEVEPVVGDLVRVAAALVDAYGANRHRLGLISLSGYTRWFGLDSGALHGHRLLAALMRTQAVTEPVWVAVDRVLDRTVRRPSMVVFVTALLDEASVGRMMRLAAAGIDVVGIVRDPTSLLSPPTDRVRAIARRIWWMERERTMDRMRSMGIAVGRMGPDTPLDQTMEEVERWRRLFRRTSV